eukprot:1187881-Prorocentrum_minimum.AAC.2
MELPDIKLGVRPDGDTETDDDGWQVAGDKERSSHMMPSANQQNCWGGSSRLSRSVTRDSPGSTLLTAVGSLGSALNKLRQRKAGQSYRTSSYSEKKLDSRTEQAVICIQTYYRLRLIKDARFPRAIMVDRLRHEQVLTHALTVTLGLV